MPFTRFNSFMMKFTGFLALCKKGLNLQKSFLQIKFFLYSINVESI